MTCNGNGEIVSAKAGRRAVLRNAMLAASALIGGAFTGRSARAADAPKPATGAGDMIRVVVTGNNAQGKSYIVKDETVKRGVVWANGSAEPTGKVGPGESAAVLPSTRPNIEPPAGGSRFFFATFPPATKKRSEIEQGSPKDGFHRTATIDYATLMNGELTVILDEGETTLHAGDAVLIRNTFHTWYNPTNSPVTLQVVMVHI